MGRGAQLIARQRVRLELPNADNVTRLLVAQATDPTASLVECRRCKLRKVAARDLRVSEFTWAKDGDRPQYYCRICAAKTTTRALGEEYAMSDDEALRVLGTTELTPVDPTPPAPSSSPSAGVDADGEALMRFFVPPARTCAPSVLIATDMAGFRTYLDLRHIGYLALRDETLVIYNRSGIAISRFSGAEADRVRVAWIELRGGLIQDEPLAIANDTGLRAENTGLRAEVDALTNELAAARDTLRDPQKLLAQLNIAIAAGAPSIADRKPA